MYKNKPSHFIGLVICSGDSSGDLLHPLALQGRGGEHGGGDDVAVHLRGVAGRKLLVPLLGLLLVVQQQHFLVL